MTANRRHPATHTPGIVVTGLRKRHGPTTALDGMTFTARPGVVTGLVGPNGAGKSTTLRVILGLDAVDAGTALVDGRPYRDLRHPLKHVGALLDASAPHPGRSGHHHLLWLAHSNGLPPRRVRHVLDLVGLTPAAHRPAGGYSLGMRQRLGLAAALLGDPPVVVLDEPLVGLDPDGVIWMRGFLRSLAAQGRTVLVSSHLMGEMQDTADHLLVVGRGRVVADAGVAELLATASADRVVLRTAAGPGARRALTPAGATVATTDHGTLTVTGLPAARVVALLTAAGVPFSEVTAHRATLEDVYLELTRDVAQFRATGGGR